MKKLGYEFTVEELIEFGKIEKENYSDNKDMVNLHDFIITCLEFEILQDKLAKKKGEEKKKFIKAYMEGTKFMKDAAATLAITAKIKVHTLGYKHPGRLKVICGKQVKKYEVFSFQGFYYRSGMRYLKAARLR